MILIDVSGAPDKRAEKIMGYFDQLSPRLRELINETGVNPSAVFGYMKYGMTEQAIVAQIKASFPHAFAK